MGSIALNFHASAAPVSLLATPEFAVEEGLVDLQSGGHAGKEGDQSFAMGLSRSKVAQHKFSIVPDAREDSGPGTGFCTLNNDEELRFYKPNTGTSGYNESSRF
jgi:hypothetical protein